MIERVPSHATGELDLDMLWAGNGSGSREVGSAPASGSASLEFGVQQWMWGCLGDGYYTQQETDELVDVVIQERREQNQVDAETEVVRKWIEGNELGRGTFGIVSEAMDATTGEMLAVKQVMAPELRPRAVEILQREMTVLRKLRHVNIVNYRGIEHEGNKLCLFMELCPGGSISTVLSSFGRLSINVVRRYTHQILSGLDYLHRHSIVHRDIKTANALLNRDGIVKLADFGGATTLSELGSGSLYGTARYLAPEVLNGGKMGRQLDIWAVGCLVVEMFTNRSPFSDQFSNDLTLMRQLRALKHSPAVPKDVPSEAVPFIEQCLRCNPAQRPSAHRLLKHSFLHQSLDEEAAIVSNASTGNSENTGTWNVEMFYAMTAMHPGRDPHLLEIKNWITTHRDEIMLLVRSGFVEGSWNWVAMLRFLWAKSTVISSRVASSIPSVRGRKRPSVRRRRDRNAAREKPIGRQLLPLKTPAVEGRDFSCELEAKYNKWLQDNTRCRLGRGTTLARSVLALGVFRLLVDVFLSNFQVTSSFERHRLDVIWCLFVSVFACIPFIPHRLVNGCMYAWRALALVIGLGICCISFFQVMAWWHISSLAFFVFCLSGALPVKDALSLSILLSCIHLINIVVHFQHGSRGQFHVSQPARRDVLDTGGAREASFTLLFTDSIMTLLLCVVSTAVIWSDRHFLKITFAVRLATDSAVLRKGA